MKTEIYDKEDKERLECYGYRKSTIFSYLTYFFSICLFGIPFLMFYWKPHWKLRFMYLSSSYENSNVILLKDMLKNNYVLDIHYLSMDKHSNLINILFSQIANDSLGNVVYMSNSNYNNNYNFSSPNYLLANDVSCIQDNKSGGKVKITYFDFRYVRYYWNPYEELFTKLDGLDDIMKCDTLVKYYSHGLTDQQQLERNLLYGPNEIPIQVKSYFNLLFQEVISPFYIFQVFSVTLWLLDKYFYYASCIILISIVSICISLYETKKQSRSIYNMVARGSSSTVTIITKSPSDHTTPNEYPLNDDFENRCLLQHWNLKTVATSSLVPGDVIAIPSSGLTMPCDAALLSGSCIVNESVLTGESIPIIKDSIGNQGCDDEIYDSMVHKKHTLFAGTHVLQARPPPGTILNYRKREEQEKITALAIVVKTGFSTTKGKLIKSILHPKPLGFEFYKDSMRFVCVLAGLACLGMLYSAYILYIRKAPIYRMILRTLDIVTIVVPPSLPAAMTVGTVYSQSRLKKNNIFCISPPRINVCGKIDLACFDKTGTLTEEGLDFWGVVPNNLPFKRFDSFVTEPSVDLPRDSLLLYSLASCHSLTLIDGDVCGDPLELKMFQATNWLLEEPSPDLSQKSSLLPTIVKPVTKECFMPNPFQPQQQHLNNNGFRNVNSVSSSSDKIPNGDEQPPQYDHAKEQHELPSLGVPIEIGIIRHFSFSSTLQCMSVMVRMLGQNHFDLFTKGAPEKIVNICLPSSVPSNHNEVLRSYTLKGFRVVSLAHRSLDKKLTWHHAQKIKRDTFERDLNFLGFLIMKNSLKPATSHVIYELIAADIRPVMVTGDNMLTAVSVAHECGLIPYGERVIAVNTLSPDEEDSNPDVDDESREKKPEVAFELIETMDSDETGEVNQAGVDVAMAESASNIFDEKKIFRFWKDTPSEIVSDKMHQPQHYLYENSLTQALLYGLNLKSVEDQPKLHRTKSAPSAVYHSISDKNQTSGDVNIIKNVNCKSKLIDPCKSDDTDEYMQLISPIYLERGSNIGRKKYHFALTGKSFSLLWQHYPKLLSKILMHGSVFARMAPDQKTLLIESYQKLGYIVSMCGDGANDCGALKAAHAGISLSEAEASVASPFTSKTQNISCIVRVIREGRCSLVTSFGIFKFMALYSMIQFISVLILYTIGTNMADRQFLYIDLGIITTIAIFMGRTGPYKNLVRERPPCGLMTFPNLFSIFSQIGLQVIFQVGALIFLKRQRWYHPPPFPQSNSSEVILCWEVTVIFWVSTFQYLIMAIAFSYDKPFRQSIQSNRLFLLSILSIVTFNTLLVVFPSSMLEQFFTLMPAGKNPHFIFRSIILVMILLNFLTSLSLERFITYLSKRSIKFRNCWKDQNLPFLNVQRQIDQDPNWPPRFKIPYNTDQK